MWQLLALYLGLVAGLSPSPANANLLRLYSQKDIPFAFAFALGGLSFDCILVFIGLTFQKFLIPDNLFLGLLSLFAAYYFARIYFQRKGKSKSDSTIESHLKFYIRGLAVQSLNPNPWIFWTSVGIFQSILHPWFPVLFLLTTYLTKLTLLRGVLRMSEWIYPIFKASFGVMSVYYIFVGLQYLKLYLQ